MKTPKTPLPKQANACLPDPILAELWEAKRQINEEAGYDIGKLARMAKDASEEIRKKWQRAKI